MLEKHDNIDPVVAAMCKCQEGTTIVSGLIIHMACEPGKSPHLYALLGWHVSDDSGLKAAVEVYRSVIEREGDASTRSQNGTLVEGRIGRARDPE